MVCMRWSNKFNMFSWNGMKRGIIHDPVKQRQQAIKVSQGSEWSSEKSITE